jgi:two-component system response regulator FixJ
MTKLDNATSGLTWKLELATELKSKVRDMTPLEALLFDALSEVLQQTRDSRTGWIALRPAVSEGLRPITTREGQVLNCLIVGKTNKETARDLGISPKTVEVHRARLKEKLGAHTTAELVRKALGSQSDN